MRQLLPCVVDPVDPHAVYADPPIARTRPGVRLNMIASLDGATSVEGLSGTLGGPADRCVFAVLRSLTDMVLVAAGTVRAEGYGPAVLPAEARAARTKRGQGPVPTIAVVSRTCNLDWQSPFFTDATARPLVITVSEAPARNRGRAAEVADVVIAGERDVVLPRALDALGDRGAKRILAEGGPTLNAQLASAGLLDELCLTLAPRLAGGESKRIIAGPALDATRDLSLCSVCEADGYLFFRYRPQRL